MTKAIPHLGLGTAPLVDIDWEALVCHAVELGYRHVDTAQMYRNEAEVGAALARVDPAEAVYLTTKVHQDRFRDGTVIASMQQSVEKLGRLPDLTLVHWPPRGIEVSEVIDLMLEVQAQGLTRDIGVSNFNRPQMRAASARAAIATNQVEFHVLIDQSALMRQADALDVPLTAYMPLVRGKAFAARAVQEIAQAKGTSPAQVCLLWIIQRGVIAIPLSSKTGNLKDNLAVLDMSLTAAEMARLDALAARENTRYSSREGWDPVWDAE